MNLKNAQLWLTDEFAKFKTWLGGRAETRLGFVGLPAAAAMGTLPAYLITRVVGGVLVAGVLAWGVHSYNEGVREGVRAEYEKAMADAVKKAEVEATERASRNAVNVEFERSRWNDTISRMTAYTAALEQELETAKSADGSDKFWTDKNVATLAGRAVAVGKMRRGQ